MIANLPPTSIARATATPQIGTWNDADRPYDHPDRLVLAQRAGAGAIYLAFNTPAPRPSPALAAEP